ESESGGDVQRELMPAMRNTAARGPSVLLQHIQNPQVLDQTVAEGAIELQDVAIRAHTCVAKQSARILNRKKIFSRSNRILIVIGQPRLQFIIERIAGFFVPSQMVGFQGMRVSNRCLEIKTSIRVHRELVAALQYFQDGLDAAYIFGK